MEKKARKILRLVLMLVFVVSTVMLLRQLTSYSKGEESREKAISMAAGGAPRELSRPAAPDALGLVPEKIEGDAHLDSLAAIDLAALQRENSDVIGWIMIPGTMINYPIVQGEDNEYYLNHTWDRQRSGTGSVFMEQFCSDDFSDFNTILYAHNLKDGSMFSILRLYEDEDYLREHPYVYLATADGLYRYEIYSAFEARVDGYCYALSFKNDEMKQDLIDNGKNLSNFSEAPLPDTHDRILTLSTCTGGSYSNRWVVQAMLNMVEPS